MRILAPIFTILLLACRPAPAEPLHAEPLHAEPAHAELHDAATCSSKLAQVARLALHSAEHPGAVVVLDARTMQELAAVDTRGEHAAPVPPGSTLKPILALSALRAGVIDPAEPLTCEGTWRRGDLELGCFAEHGALDLSTALATSCNAYFYELATRLGPTHIASSFEQVGLGALAQLVRNPADNPQVPYLAHALGHGKTVLAPTELAHAYAAMLRSGGPQLAFVLAGLVDAVTSPHGTARGANVAGLEVAGKTGTAQTVDDGVAHTHAWFVGHAPAHDPRVVVLTYIDGEGTGGESAAPVAHDVLSAWSRDCGPSSS
jgi:cell division protein FtsI/penicillin-binding protein 2